MAPMALTAHVKILHGLKIPMVTVATGTSITKILVATMMMTISTQTLTAVHAEEDHQVTHVKTLHGALTPVVTVATGTRATKNLAAVMMMTISTQTLIAVLAEEDHHGQVVVVHAKIRHGVQTPVVTVATGTRTTKNLAAIMMMTISTQTLIAVLAE